MRGKEITAGLGCLFLVSVFVIVMEIDISFLSKDRSERQILRNEIITDRPTGDGAVKIDLNAQRASGGRKTALAISDDVGTRSKYNGLHQRERQRWLREEERRLMETMKEGTPSAGGDRVFACRGGGAFGTNIDVPGQRRRLGASRDASSGMSEADAGALAEQARSLGEDGGVCEDYLDRVRMGVDLWDGTYVPAIAPDEKQRLLSKWAGSGGVGKKESPRILYVISSFDRGQRLREGGYSGDKLDYILMMMDEVREACEAGFTPHVHLIAAWDATPEFPLLRERSLCQRTGEPVSLSFKEYPPTVMMTLSVKHRIYMQSRLDDFDLFIQAEDDMILTVNHILLYFEELEKLTFRKGKRGPPDYNFAPGFIRVEPELAEEGNVPGHGGEWFEWEIILSRIEGVQVDGAGVYLTLHPSKVVPVSGNNQALWMATQGQLRHLNESCGYLDYTESSARRNVAWFSGSLEMFSETCKIKKVFPADRFEDFLIHHRTNNKNGKRGESMPATSVSSIRSLASQVLRDAPMLRELEEARRSR